MLLQLFLHCGREVGEAEEVPDIKLESGLGSCFCKALRDTLRSNFLPDSRRLYLGTRKSNVL